MHGVSPALGFQVPPMLWRGLSLETAMYSLSSRELQDIVNQAIRRCSKPSAIRLLSPRVLNLEMPKARKLQKVLQHQLKESHNEEKLLRKNLLNKLCQSIGSLTEENQKCKEELESSMLHCDNHCQLISEAKDRD